MMKHIFQGFKMSFFAALVTGFMIGVVVVGDYVFSSGSYVYSFLYAFFVLGVVLSFILYLVNSIDDSY